MIALKIVHLFITYLLIFCIRIERVYLSISKTSQIIANCQAIYLRILLIGSSEIYVHFRHWFQINSIRSFGDRSIVIF